MPNDKKKAGMLRDDMPRQPLRQRPAYYERRDKSPLDNDIYLNPNMPKDTPKMRASTTGEKVGDLIRSAYESLAEQPLGMLADKVGLTNFRGLATPTPNGESRAEMQGLPGTGILSKMGRNTGVAGKLMSGPPESATAIGRSHPALPAEFNMQVRNPSRTAPIDMNNLPSGKMEYLDPDVAEYMNPKRMLDFTDPATQKRLRFLTGK